VSEHINFVLLAETVEVPIFRTSIVDRVFSVFSPWLSLPSEVSVIDWRLNTELTSAWDESSPFFNREYSSSEIVFVYSDLPHGLGGERNCMSMSQSANNVVLTVSIRQDEIRKHSLQEVVSRLAKFLEVGMSISSRLIGGVGSELEFDAELDVDKLFEAHIKTDLSGAGLVAVRNGYPTDDVRQFVRLFQMDGILVLGHKDSESRLGITL